MTPKMAELKAKVKLLCEEYKDTHGVFILLDEDESDEVIMSGSMCPVCALEKLIHLIMVYDLKHTNPAKEEKEKKEQTH